MLKSTDGTRYVDWVSPHTADPARAGYVGRTRPRSVTHDGRRFLVWPEPMGPGWCWRERGTDAAYTASSEILAYLTIGGLCAVDRARQKGHL